MLASETSNSSLFGISKGSRLTAVINLRHDPPFAYLSSNYRRILTDYPEAIQKNDGMFVLRDGTDLTQCTLRYLSLVLNQPHPRQMMRKINISVSYA